MRPALPAALALCAVLTACSSADDGPAVFNAQARADRDAAKQRVADRGAVNAGFAPAQPAPLETASVDPVKAPAPGALLPPASMQYRYIGRWAATAAQCEGGVWKIETRRLTAGKTNCDLPTVAAVPSGYELQGVCRADGVKTPQTLKLTFDERGKRMQVAGKTMGPTTLLYCGD